MLSDKVILRIAKTHFLNEINNKFKLEQREKRLELWKSEMISNDYQIGFPVTTYDESQIIPGTVFDFQSFPESHIKDHFAKMVGENKCLVRKTTSLRDADYHAYEFLKLTTPSATPPVIWILDGWDCSDYARSRVAFKILRTESYRYEKIVIAE